MIETSLFHLQKKGDKWDLTGLQKGPNWIKRYHKLGLNLAEVPCDLQVWECLPSGPDPCPHEWKLGYQFTYQYHPKLEDTVWWFIGVLVTNEFSLFTQKLLKILLQALMSLATFMMDSQINDVPMTIKFKMGPILWAWNIAPVQIAGTIFYLRINNSMKSCMPDDMMHHRKGYQGAHSCGMARLRSSRYFQTYIIFRSTLNIINLQSARQFGHNWSTCHNRNNMLENTLSP